MFHIQLLWDLEEFLFYRVLWATVMVKSEAYPVPCYIQKTERKMFICASCQNTTYSMKKSNI